MKLKPDYQTKPDILFCILVVFAALCAGGVVVFSGLWVGEKTRRIALEQKIASPRSLQSRQGNFAIKTVDWFGADLEEVRVRVQDTAGHTHAVTFTNLSGIAYFHLAPKDRWQFIATKSWVGFDTVIYNWGDRRKILMRGYSTDSLMSW